jgi:hypothetical protein
VGPGQSKVVRKRARRSSSDPADDRDADVRSRENEHALAGP